MRRDTVPKGTNGNKAGPAVLRQAAALLAEELQPKSDDRRLLAALNRFKRGDFTVRLPDDGTGINARIADAFNEVVEQNERMARKIERLGRVVGKQGKLNQRAFLGDAAGAWATSIAYVNELIEDLVHPTTETACVIGAVAKGNLSQTMALERDGRPLEGEFLKTAKTVNTMVNQLSSFASEVTRVAREVGTEGKLGGQARVKGVAGTWKDLTDNVNLMAGNLTAQVRNIADVTTAVAKGDLSKKITVDVKGEILELKDTINTMVDQLSSFASEVTRVAREVGTEGKLGGQAYVGGVSGIWKDLTDNVNSMAVSLTTTGAQHREGRDGGGQRRFAAEADGRRQGRDRPANVIILPVVFEGQVKAVLELASFERFSMTHQVFLHELMESIGIVLNTI